VKLVVDSSVLIAALMRDSTVRELLLNPFFEFYVPEHYFEEIERHVDEISKRSVLSVQNVYLLLGILLASVQVVPAESILEWIGETEKIMGKIDMDDVPFVALALSFLNDGIWTEDRHFLKQRRVKVWLTRDLLKLIRE
jgi:predicted nucleic acid-binding protein